MIAGFDASGLPIFVGVRFTDGDAVLVRGDVPAANAQVGVYDADLPVAIGDVTTAVYQGWSSAEATIGPHVLRACRSAQSAADVRPAHRLRLHAQPA